MEPKYRSSRPWPFFTYFGAKWRRAIQYPPPTHDVIVEPFAGAAGYALTYAHRDVVIMDVDENVADTWEFLLAATADDLRSIPDIPDGGTVDDIDAPRGARLLAGWWCHLGCTAPGKRPSTWSRSSGRFWGQRIRERLARQIGAIRHWTFIRASYEAAPDVDATWFIDPPY